MKLNKLPKTTTKSKKRLGRGYGSGKGGHTVGKGQKGQKSRGRGKIPLYFEGTAMRKSLIRRLPMMRGKTKNISYRAKPAIINIKLLNGFKAKTTVDLKALIKYGLVSKTQAQNGVKILGDGELKVALKVVLPTSKSAAEKIEAAGGEVIKKNKTNKSVTAGNVKGTSKKASKITKKSTQVSKSKKPTKVKKSTKKK